MELNPYETLSLLEWSHRYYRELKQFGIHDDSVETGYIQLCIAYARKTHCQVLPMVVGILRQERYEPRRTD